MGKHHCVGINTQDELLFDIHVTERVVVTNVPKSAILNAVKVGIPLQIATASDLLSNVIDKRKLDIYAKLYCMGVTDKINTWMSEYTRFMSLPLRPEQERRRLLDQYNLIIMESHAEVIEPSLNKKANECASKLVSLHI